MVQSGMNDWQVLYCCMGDEYFITTTGAFRQRPMSIISISKEEALKLLHDEQEDAVSDTRDDDSSNSASNIKTLNT